MSETAPPIPPDLVPTVLDWYARSARDLPWRRPDCTPWGVMVSEFMLQQTPVARVLEPWRQWLQRWPQPIDLALAPAGEAVRAWGRLGYPRRALRLHAAAVAIVEQHDGSVPADEATLRSLPGVGAYTAAAISSFAFGRRAVVLDTNVRRVIARAVTGEEFPPPSPTVGERATAERLVPDAEPARWAAASMELGAVVCRATAPDCAGCPIRSRCRWLELGRPAYAGPPRRGQSYAGTDRQVRGLLLGLLRENEEPVPAAALAAVWADHTQRTRALDSLVHDGLVIRIDSDHFALPR